MTNSHQSISAGSDTEQVFIDICDELGCAYDNESALMEIDNLKRRAAGYRDDAQPTPEPVAYRWKYLEDTFWTLAKSSPGEWPDVICEPLYAAQPPAAPVERPKCKLCGLEDGACICAHLRPRSSAASEGVEAAAKEIGAYLGLYSIDVKDIAEIRSVLDRHLPTEPQPTQVTMGLKTNPELLALIERAKTYVMSPEEVYEQRRSFTRGMCPSNRDYTEWCEAVDRLLPPLSLSRAERG